VQLSDEYDACCTFLHIQPIAVSCLRLTYDAVTAFERFRDLNTLPHLESIGTASTASSSTKVLLSNTFTTEVFDNSQRGHDILILCTLSRHKFPAFATTRPRLLRPLELGVEDKNDYKSEVTAGGEQYSTACVYSLVKRRSV
jgi:hypothetical protein